MAPPAAASRITNTIRTAFAPPPPLPATFGPCIVPGGGGGPPKSNLHVVHVGASGLFALPHRGQRFGMMRGSFGVSSSVGMTLGVVTAWARPYRNRFGGSSTLIDRNRLSFPPKRLPRRKGRHFQRSS